MINEQLIEILDRKYNFLIKVPDGKFVLELAAFMDFIKTYEPICHFTEKVYRDFELKSQDYKARLDKEQEKAIGLKREIIEKYPDLDDSKMEYPGPEKVSNEYRSSFAAFDDIVNKVERVKSFQMEPDILDDKSDVGKLILIIRTKIDEYKTREEKGNKTREIDEQIWIEYRNLREQHEHTQFDWINYCRISPGCTILEFSNMCEEINPEPKNYASKEDFFEKWSGIDDLKVHWYYGSWVQDAVYGLVSKYANYKSSDFSDERIKEGIEKLREGITRIYESLRVEIGLTLLPSQLVHRYKLRSQWYNKEYLWSLIDSFEKGKKASIEHIVTQDVAKYLFDQGITVFYRFKAGQHEFDLLEDAKSPLFVEVKIYKDNGSKHRLIQGIAELHAYLNNVKSLRGIKNAYYVIFRLAGPIYEFPEMIHTNQFSIYPILIDIGESKVSGSRQPKPIIIKPEEIFAKL
ncbi:hypothetical protein KAW96_08585 [candidate division WOR-3 bacterium]|nr:hypothetical protein [candidate division WOR-3 bacterium]